MRQRSETPVISRDKWQTHRGEQKSMQLTEIEINIRKKGPWGLLLDIVTTNQVTRLAAIYYLLFIIIKQ
jgi:hypothetical protein